MSESAADESCRTGPFSRRQLLQIGGLGGFGLSLARLLQSEDARAAQRSASERQTNVKSCILIFFYGGPSHLDTWDLTPTAPLEVRGEFRTVATSAAGHRV